MINSALIRLAIIAIALAAAAAWGYTEGMNRESDRRDALDLKARADADKAYDAAAARGVSKARESIASRRKADNYYRQLQEQIAHADPSTLLGPSPVPPPPDGGAKGPDRIELLLTGEFVRLYNAAWAGAGTQVPADPGGAAGAPAGAAAAGPEEVLAHTVAETESCGDDRRRYLKLIELLSQPPWSVP